MDSASSLEPRRGAAAFALAAAWGFAEATLFFIVPDVLLSWIALSDYKRALKACLWALAGALLGGSLIWLAGHSAPEAIRATYVLLPGIDAAMVAAVQDQLENQGLLGLFIGPATGTPYKIYALEAGHVGYGLAIFLLVSIPARLIRFVLVASLAAGVGRLLERFCTRRTMLMLHLAGWTVFYGWFFWLMSG